MHPAPNPRIGYTNHTQDVPWAYIPSAARNEAAYNSKYGPVHTWVHQRLDEAPTLGKKYVTVKAGSL